ncbi:MAG: cupredoxin domain-containing protein [Candidatus Kapabacteria bacterium]|jgi:plastocyanin domain-containing protein|nr:cupredoxin domain-containing protein [Candidatus Kapabacteria bacterium]
MDTSQILVTLGGLGLVVFVVWYFFFGKRTSTAAALTESGVQEIAITVKGGYSPDSIEVVKDKPVRLKFYRDETSSCSEELVFGEFSLRRELPAFETTVIDILPTKTGTFEFTCGMNMLRGKLIVR